MKTPNTTILELRKGVETDSSSIAFEVYAPKAANLADVFVLYITIYSRAPTEGYKHITRITSAVYIHNHGPYSPDDAIYFIERWGFDSTEFKAALDRMGWSGLYGNRS